MKTEKIKTPIQVRIPNLEIAFLDGKFRSIGQPRCVMQGFKKGDIIVNKISGVLAVVQLNTNNLDINNYNNGITGNSSGNILTSHIISPNWIRVVPIS